MLSCDLELILDCPININLLRTLIQGAFQYIDIWLCQSSDLGTLRHYCTMLCGYFHSGPETRTHMSDCVNEQYRGLRAISVCNRHGWLRAVS